jgi:hypothetical protein
MSTPIPRIVRTLMRTLWAPLTRKLCSVDVSQVAHPTQHDGAPVDAVGTDIAFLRQYAAALGTPRFGLCGRAVGGSIFSSTGAGIGSRIDGSM